MVSWKIIGKINVTDALRVAVYFQISLGYQDESAENIIISIRNYYFS